MPVFRPRHRVALFMRDSVGYIEGPDAFGNRRRIFVTFHHDYKLYRHGVRVVDAFNLGDRVESWKYEPLPRTRPHWLDQAMKEIVW